MREILRVYQGVAPVMHVMQESYCALFNIIIIIITIQAHLRFASLNWACTPYLVSSLPMRNGQLTTFLPHVTGLDIWLINILAWICKGDYA